MARSRSRDRGWPPVPEPLPVPVVDDHTHLDTVVGWQAGGWVRDADGTAQPDEGARALAPDTGPVQRPSDGEAEQRPSDGDAEQRPSDEGAVQRPSDEGAVQRPSDERAGRAAPGEARARALPDDEDGRLVAHLERAAAVGVSRMVQVGCDLDAVRWTDRVVAAHPALLGAVAIHPNEAVLHAGVREVAPDGLDPDPQRRHDVTLDDALAEVARVAAANPRVRAVGETGLDHFRAGERGRAVQREAFRAHVALAKELGLALQIHDRDAHGEVVDVLRRDGAPERTVFHCFSGDAELARLCVAEGWFLSFAGPVSFPANEDLRAALRETPPELLLVETDAPYLTVHPFRGRPNAPYVLPGTVRTVAEVTGRGLEQVCAQVSATAEHVYGTW